MHSVRTQSAVRSGGKGGEAVVIFGASFALDRRDGNDATPDGCDGCGSESESDGGCAAAWMVRVAMRTGRCEADASSALVCSSSCPFMLLPRFFFFFWRVGRRDVSAAGGVETITAARRSASFSRSPMSHR